MSACSTNWDSNYLRRDMISSTWSTVSANFDDIPNGFTWWVNFFVLKNVKKTTMINSIDMLQGKLV